MAAPGGEAMQRSPGTPNGDVIEHSDDEKDRQDYLEVNFKYPLILDRDRESVLADNRKISSLISNNLPATVVKPG